MSSWLNTFWAFAKLMELWKAKDCKSDGLKLQTPAMQKGFTRSVEDFLVPIGKLCNYTWSASNSCGHTGIEKTPHNHNAKNKTVLHYSTFQKKNPFCLRMLWTGYSRYDIIRLHITSLLLKLQLLSDNHLETERFLYLHQWILKLVQWVSKNKQRIKRSLAAKEFLFIIYLFIYL